MSILRTKQSSVFLALLFMVDFGRCGLGYLQQTTPAAWLLLLFLVLAGCITVMDVRYLNRSQANARSAAEVELEAIADLKVQQLVNWRRERLADANLWVRFSGKGLNRGSLAGVSATKAE